MTQHAQQSVAAADLPERGQPLAGGTFFARYWLNGEERALVLLDEELTGAWGEYGQVVAGAKSYSDGAANTRAMAEAGSALAVKVLELGAHIPSHLEGALMMSAKADGVITLREDRWHWLSTQYSAYYAFLMDFEDGWIDSNDKHYERLVRPVRSLIIQ
ncbi:hypothetical protein [Pseudomonas fitomaticsae]|uniref:DUF1566 domain-containing protein n=1 Tax=Pseudomonas fitomaticsae TaxID=2837969 RepID=A0ABY3Q822_9PSED|nr:hypothetical protein [Pseudomonas fitomaticsae]UFQ02217.1 hypothetical protein KJY40_11190 [Pseudomonas fitomaticsae]